MLLGIGHSKFAKRHSLWVERCQSRPHGRHEAVKRHTIDYAAGGELLLALEGFDRRFGRGAKVTVDFDLLPMKAKPFLNERHLSSGITSPAGFLEFEIMHGISLLFTLRDGKHWRQLGYFAWLALYPLSGQMVIAARTTEPTALIVARCVGEGPVAIVIVVLRPYAPNPIKEPKTPSCYWATVWKMAKG
jgi:hypothetical protein